MCRRNELAAVMIAVTFGTIAVIAGVSARADEVAAFLEQHQLRQLLAVHLEQQMAQAAPEQRADLVLRLAALYAELLEAAIDPAEQANLKERSRRLLEQAPPSGAEELRLALLRSAYRAAEKIVESHRLRLTQPGEVESAKAALDEIVPQFASLRTQIRQSFETADRRLSRAGGADVAVMSEHAERIRSMHAQCTFLNAWALYYQAWLDGRPEPARAAEALFGELLSVEHGASASPSDVSIDLRSTEAVARSVLGMALCKSLSASSATAITWIELLEHPNTFEPLRAQAATWRMAVHLEHGEFEEARDALDRQAAVQAELPLALLRLIAVYALEDAGRSRQSDELVKFAVTQLAARGELEQVLDLARRYGTEPLGKSGFALRYVHGVMAYQQARQAHDGEMPTLDAEIGSRYEQAAEGLRAALEESDAGKYEDAAAACRRLIAWCRYFQGRFLDAAAAFEDAASKLAGPPAAEALWMAIVSLDKVAEAGGGPDLQARLDALAQRFLHEHPSSAHAPKLRMRRALAHQRASPEAVAELLAIGPQSEVYGAAQRRAADLLYQLFRSSSGQERLAWAAQFLNVATPLLSPAARAADLADQAESHRHIVRCRQVLEVALTEGVDRLIPARTALEAWDELRQSAAVDLTPFDDEIECRRAQERLYSDDPDAAVAIADALWSRDQGSVWSRLAARAVFKHAHRVWRSDDASTEQKNRAMEMIVRHGGRVLHEFKDDPAALDQSAALSYHVAVAEASMALWERTGDAERGRAALFVYEKLLAKRPRNATFLRANAMLQQKVGDRDKALDCWRRVVAGLPEEEPAWFEAKFHLIELLASSDPARAREVMNQHKQLNPDYGPEPWGARLKGLDLQIPDAAPTSAPGEPTTQPDANPQAAYESEQGPDAP